MTSNLRYRPTVESLEIRQLMAADGGLGDVSATPEKPVQVATITDITISGNTANAEGGGPVVNVDPSSVAGYSANLGGGGAYPGFTGGVRVATGDINSDGTPDIVAAPGPGGGPHVKVFGATPVDPAQADVADRTTNTIMVGETLRLSRFAVRAGGGIENNNGVNSHDGVFAELGRDVDDGTTSASTDGH